MGVSSRASFFRFLAFIERGGEGGEGGGVGEGVGHNDPGVFWKSRKWSRASGLRLEACLIRRLGGTGNDKPFSI